MIQLRVIIIQRSKSWLVAIQSPVHVYSALSIDARRELLSGHKEIVSNKPELLEPFTEQLVAVTFRGMYVTGPWIIAKVKPALIRHFIERNVKPGIPIVLQNRYKFVINYENKDKFINDLDA